VARVQLGDSVQKEMTVLFFDMRGFSALVEGQTPEQNIAFINEYLGAMEPAILGHGGFVDSYLGDAIMALFDGDPADAITAGVEMFTRLGAYNAQRASRGLGAVRIGVGLNAGLLTLGTIGGPQRIKCGVIGDPVNLAARVESLTKSYQAPLLTTDTTLERAGGRFLAREVDRVRVVGRQTPVTLVEVFDADPAPLRERKQATLSSWHEALARYHARDFTVAASLFAAVREALPQDAVARLRHERCLGLLSVPPPGDWDGVATLEKK
jgi:class 3 adenylate cyclase